MTNPHETVGATTKRHPHRSMLVLPAAHRVLVAAGAMTVLWLAVLWSVSLP